MVTRFRAAAAGVIFAVAACGDNIPGESSTLQMCLINALENCSRLTDCGLIDDLDAAQCPSELKDECCAQFDCDGTLPVTRDERFECIDRIDAMSCEQVADAPMSLPACLGWE